MVLYCGIHTLGKCQNRSKMFVKNSFCFLLLLTAGTGFGSFYLFVAFMCDIMNCMFTYIFCWKRILPIIEVIVILC